MKIRNGFVSNSSSSSFCIYGTTLDYDETITLLKNRFRSNLLLKFTEELNDETFDSDLNNLIDEAGLAEIVDNINLPLYYTYHFSEMMLYLGKELSSMDDDETFGQFKEKIKQELKEKYDIDHAEILETIITD